MLLYDRFQKELARLGDASAELQEKSATLNEVEGLLAKEKQTVRGLTDQVRSLFSSSPVCKVDPFLLTMGSHHLLDKFVGLVFHEG